MNYIDKDIKTIEENDTVGTILCKQDNEYVIKYFSDDRIIAREYEFVWYNIYISMGYLFWFAIAYFKIGGVYENGKY